jgi:hypothetical protein
MQVVPPLLVGSKTPCKVQFNVPYATKMGESVSIIGSHEKLGRGAIFWFLTPAQAKASSSQGYLHNLQTNRLPSQRFKPTGYLHTPSSQQHSLEAPPAFHNPRAYKVMKTWFFKPLLYQTSIKRVNFCAAYLSGRGTRPTRARWSGAKAACGSRPWSSPPAACSSTRWGCGSLMQLTHSARKRILSTLGPMK